MGGNGNPPPSDSDPVEFENPSAGFKAGKLSEEFVFQGDKDVVRRGVKTEVGEKKEASHLLDGTEVTQVAPCVAAIVRKMSAVNYSDAPVHTRWHHNIATMPRNMV